MKHFDQNHARNGKVKKALENLEKCEIDIVALSPEGKVVFVEVKTRSSIAYGDPLEAISNDKAMRIQRLALAWLATHQRLGCDFRIDAAGILVSRSGAITIDYREGIL